MGQRVTRLLLLVALCCLLITACSSLTIQQSRNATQQVERTTECRIIEHPLGKTCIPLKPQRIVSLESLYLDTLFALEVNESIVGRDCYPMRWVGKGCIVAGLSPSQTESIESIGNYPPSLEKILFLKPDLILGSDNAKSIYNQLSDIAPTVTIYWNETKYSYKTFIRRIAQILDRKEAAEKILVQYQNRIAKIKNQLSDRLKDAEVSVIIYGCAGNNGFSLPPRYAIWFQILDDIGIKIKPIFSMTQDAWCSAVNSIEIINNYDSDILFIANFHSKSGEFLLENPLISSLKAVKNKRAYVIDGQDIWDAYGPSGVNKLMDLLFKHLLEAAQSI